MTHILATGPQTPALTPYSSSHFLTKTTVLSVLCAGLLVACGGGGGGSASSTLASGYPSAPASCDTTGQRAWLRDYMTDQYLWHDQQGSPNESASSMASYLDSLLNKPIDRYSYSQSTALFTQFFTEGTRTGYGYSLAWADAAQTVLKVRVVEPLSPVAAAGLQRGDTVVSIDGFSPAQVVAGALATVSTAGVLRAFVVQNAAGTVRSLNVLSAEFALSPVLASQVLTAPNGAKVGYLMYQEFITTGAAALGAAIESFRTAGVAHVIVDLRYNGGGSTTQARNLASMLGGTALSGQVFAQYRYSAKQSAQNFTQNFSSSGLPATPLDGIDKIVVITSASTASASEMVINALRPFKPVATIGSTTFGKPYAFQPRDACDTTYSAVNIEIANAAGFADYSAGFAPTCAVGDDLSRQLGDPAEQRTAAALGYIATGACPVVAANLYKNTALAQSGIAQAATKSIATDGRLQELGFGETGPRQARLD